MDFLKSEVRMQKLEERKRYQDILERTFDFACDIVKLHAGLSRHGVTRRTIVNQLLRAGTSIGANLEESRGGQSKPDFIAKTRIALKEARESYYWLRILAKCELGPPDDLRKLESEANELVAILTTIVKNASARSS
jgi:four helix bundle protein